MHQLTNGPSTLPIRRVELRVREAFYQGANVPRRRFDLVNQRRSLGGVQRVRAALKSADRIAIVFEGSHDTSYN
jgi:hypothetical protein